MSKHQGKKCVICNSTGKEGFFTFPSGEILKIAWLEKCPEDFREMFADKKIPDSRRICFRHFNVQTEIKTTFSRYRLVPGKIVKVLTSDLHFLLAS